MIAQYDARPVTHYQTLGISPKAEAQEIKSAFRALAVKHHPDKGGDARLFAVVQEAYAVLSESARRAEYDGTLKKRPVNDLGESARRLVREYCDTL